MTLICKTLADDLTSSAWASLKYRDVFVEYYPVSVYLSSSLNLKASSICQYRFQATIALLCSDIEHLLKRGAIISNFAVNLFILATAKIHNIRCSITRHKRRTAPLCASVGETCALGSVQISA